MLRACKSMAAASVLVSLVACGGSKAATKASTAANTSPPPAHLSKPAKQATTSASVKVDDLRTACGVHDDDAYFSFDSHSLRSKDLALLDQVARCFSSGALAGKTLKLVGRADPRGTSDYNMALGQQRAEAVAQYVEKRGIGSGRVVVTSRGAMDDGGSGQSAWEKDRRVDLVVGS